MKKAAMIIDVCPTCTEPLRFEVRDVTFELGGFKCFSPQAPSLVCDKCNKVIKIVDARPAEVI